MAYGRLRSISWLLLVAVIGGCLPAQIEPPSPSARGDPPSATTTAGPVASGTPRTSSADEIFDRVAPSVAFVATDIGTGSGLTIDDRHVATNAHVVRPYVAARVRFADGREVKAAPVVGWDLMADLAVLDVGVGLGRRPLTVKAEMPRTGARVYLVGYPLADMASPSATITEGIISGSPLEWQDELTFHQTDAVIENGQSGGVLVDSDGRLIGITGGSRGRFAIALDGSDAIGRIKRLLTGEDVDGTGDHLLPTPDLEGVKQIHTTIRHRADAHVWVVAGGPGDPAAKVTISSDRTVGLFGMAAAGKLGHAAGPPGKKLELEVAFDAVGPYAVKVEAAGGGVADVTMRSTAALTPLEDPDDGAAISSATPRIGAADYAGDLDWYVLSMSEGQKATIRASAAALDPALFIDRVGSSGPPLANGHDSGGPLGGDDEVEFRAPSTGDYLVVVSDARFQGAGAYRLTVDLH